MRLASPVRRTLVVLTVIVLNSVPPAIAGAGESPNADAAEAQTPLETIVSCLQDVLRAETTGDETAAPGGRQSCIFKHSTPCSAGVTDSAAIMACSDAETAAWDKILNDVYRAIKTAAGKDLFAVLQTYQRTWMSFRDGFCGREQSQEMEQRFRDQARQACLTQETARRVFTLIDVHDDLLRPAEGRYSGYYPELSDLENPERD